MSAPLKNRTARSFIILFLGFFVFFGVFSWMRNQEESDGLPGPFRKFLEYNERIGHYLLDPDSLDVVHEKAPPPGEKPRFNGSIGLESPLDLNTWKLQIASPVGTQAPAMIELTMKDLLKLPRQEEVIELKCIEGWSQTLSVAGVRFSELLSHYRLGTHSGLPINLKSNTQDLFSYVGLETPDGEYYVSVDMKSMLNPQTLLAYEVNGLPLEMKEGAPLRLIIPNKYGVKNLKRIGKIQFADTQLPDYWGEQGYGWFLGL